MKQILFDPIFLPLILGVVIIYALLAFHLSSSKKVSFLFGDIFTIFFLCLVPKLVIFPFNKFDLSVLSNPVFTLASATGIIVMAFYGSSFILLHLYYHKYLEHTLSILKDPFLGTLIILAVCSTFWAYETEKTLRATLVILFLSSLAAHISRRYSLPKISSLMRISHTIVAFLSAFYALAKPSIGIHEKGWKGIAIHPNFLAIIMALSVLIWTIDALNKPKYPGLSWGMAAFSFFILQMANSAGAFVTAMLMLMMIGLLRVLKSLTFQQAFTAIVLFLVLGIVIMILLTENWVSVLSSLGKDPTLTGRTEFWPMLIDAINQRPVLGYGYHNFWQPWRGVDNPAAGVITPNGFKPPHAHNGFIEIGLDLGYIGLSLFILSFFRNLLLGSMLLTQSKRLESLLPTIFMGYLLFQNVTESRLFGANFVWFYYVLFTVKLNHIHEELKKERELTP
ncbi:MAG: O-antigen ligase family protein [Limnoraphis sp. WC205]|jgi:exopolysaccharide production protein ExoQ|nr:O-antigen ligase family protein [Limnoraphis sp. WC205]